MERKLVIGGHRGHKSEIRENTIANFEQIKKMDISYIAVSYTHLTLPTKA